MSRWFVLLIVISVFAGYVVLGGIVFHFLERSKARSEAVDVDEKKKEFLQNHTCLSNDELSDLIENVINAYNQGVINKRGDARTDDDRTWSVHQSIYFASTIVSTIGYGNTAPVTSGGRLFTVVFACIGIPLALCVYAKVGRLLDYGLSRVVGRFFVDATSKKAKITRSIINLIGGVFVFVLIPPILFMRNEDWTYGEGVYYSFITLTTIGLGDFVAGFDNYSTPPYHMFVSTWILVGLAWMSSLVSNAYDIFDKTVKKVLHENDAMTLHENDAKTKEPHQNDAMMTVLRENDTESAKQIYVNSPETNPEHNDKDQQVDMPVACCVTTPNGAFNDTCNSSEQNVSHSKSMS